MIATAKYLSQLGDFEHHVISLKTPVPGVAEMAKEAGMVVLNPPDQAAIMQEIENADIVHIHYWNHPQMQEFLRSEFPAMRLLMWFHIAGDKPPQIITQELVGYSDFAIPCNPYSYELPVFQNLSPEVRLKKVGMVYDAADFERVSDIQLKPHDTFNVGYIGSVSLSKMHHNYVPMSAAVNIPNVQFIVCGSGMEDYLRQQAEELGASQRFDFRGYVEDIKSVIESLDIYGYPLYENTYAAGELNLQEVMYAGIPPIVFPYGGIKDLVIDNYTGLVVRSELEYKHAIEYLYHHPEERARLGQNAKEYARQIFGAENAAKSLNLIYDRLMKFPKRTREWGIFLDENLLYQPVSLQDLTGEPEQYSGAKLFIQSLGDSAPEFIVSMTSPTIQELFEAEQKIATSSLLLSRGEGSIFQYRNAYQNDPYLRLWTGLVMQHQEQHEQAITEFLAALNLGCNHWRVYWYLAKAAQQANDIALAKKALTGVLQAVPNFITAQEMLQNLEPKLAAYSELVNLNLKEINLIIFPDWNQSEDSLYQDLAGVLGAIATHPDKHRITLLIDITNIAEADAELALSGMMMNLLMEEGLEVEDTEEPTISLVGQLNATQWEALWSRIYAKVALSHESKDAIAPVITQKMLSLEPDRLKNLRVMQSDTGSWHLG